MNRSSDKLESVANQIAQETMEVCATEALDRVDTNDRKVTEALINQLDDDSRIVCKETEKILERF